MTNNLISSPKEKKQLLLHLKTEWRFEKVKIFKGPLAARLTLVVQKMAIFMYI